MPSNAYSSTVLTNFFYNNYWNDWIGLSNILLGFKPYRIDLYCNLKPNAFTLDLNPAKKLNNIGEL
jgi:hypothetical protein